MADSEVRQKFEAWAQRRKFDLSLNMTVFAAEIPYANKEAQSHFDAFAAGMRAGEIAMKEKAAQLANSCARILPPEHRVAATWIGDKIRALPLWG